MNASAKLLTVTALASSVFAWAVCSPEAGAPDQAQGGTRSGAVPPVRRAAQARPATPPAQTERQPAGLTRDQAAALASLEALLANEDGSADAGLAPLRAWAQQDPAAAAAWVTAHLHDGARRRALTEVIALWADRSPAAALAWLDALPDSAGNEEPYAAALSALAASDAPAAAAWLAQHPGLASRENCESLLSHWTAADPAAASSWLLAHPNAAMREALLPAVVAGLQDPQAAAALVQQAQPVHPDAVLAAAAEGVGQSAPQYALDLAAQVSGEAARDTLTQNILRDYDPAADGIPQLQPALEQDAAAPMPAE